MKKFFTDNIVIIVILALALAGFAVYKQYKGSKAETTTPSVKDESLTA